MASRPSGSQKLYRNSRGNASAAADHPDPYDLGSKNSAIPSIPPPDKKRVIPQTKAPLPSRGVAPPFVAQNAPPVAAKKPAAPAAPKAAVTKPIPGSFKVTSRNGVPVSSNLPPSAAPKLTSVPKPAVSVAANPKPTTTPKPAPKPAAIPKPVAAIPKPEPSKTPPSKHSTVPRSVALVTDDQPPIQSPPQDQKLALHQPKQGEDDSQDSFDPYAFPNPYFPPPFPYMMMMPPGDYHSASMMMSENHEQENFGQYPYPMALPPPPTPSEDNYPSSASEYLRQQAENYQDSTSAGDQMVPVMDHSEYDGELEQGRGFANPYFPSGGPYGGPHHFQPPPFCPPYNHYKPYPPSPPRPGHPSHHYPRPPCPPSPPCENNDCDADKIVKKIYDLTCWIRKRCEKAPLCRLRQRDFDQGTYRIRTPGCYELTENIVFNPNPSGDYLPDPRNPEYQDAPYSLGFFAAITIETDGVVLDLNGYTIRQGKEHALKQRFFAVIETASSPFIPGQGPGNFGKHISSGKNILIESSRAGGTIGLSSHHGIHGNGSENVVVRKITIRDFEVAGIALNGGQGLYGWDVVIGPNRKDVPVLATFSATRFSCMFAQQMLQDPKYANQLNAVQRQDIQTKLDALLTVENQVFTEVMQTGKTTHPLFANPGGLPDGNNYAVLIHPIGVAVNDFVEEDFSGKLTKDVAMVNVVAKDIVCKVNEIIGVSGPDGKGVQTDAAGGVFQIDLAKHPTDGTYVPNVLADLQIAMAAPQLAIAKLSISSHVVSWAKTPGSPFDDSVIAALDTNYQFKCNGDSMFHVNKGLNVFRFDGVKDLTLIRCLIDKAENQGRLGNEEYCGAYEFSHDAQTRPGYRGADLTGYSFSRCFDVCMFEIEAKNLKSRNGDARGIRLINGCKYVNMNYFKLQDICAGHLFDNGKWFGTSYGPDEELAEYTASFPNTVPSAIGVKVEDDCKDVDIGKHTISGLHAPGCKVPIWIN